MGFKLEDFERYIAAMRQRRKLGSTTLMSPFPLKICRTCRKDASSQYDDLLGRVLGKRCGYLMLKASVADHRFFHKSRRKAALLFF
jgi:hypothetical protein